MDRITQHYKDNYRKLVKRMSFRSGTDWDAEDIVQEAYARALKYEKSFVEGMAFDNWFNTILNNCLREHKNNAGGFTHQSFEEEDVEGVECTHYSDKVMHEIYELINTKSLAQIEVLMLHFKQSFSPKEISQVTEYTYKAVLQMLYRFRKELQQLYG